MDDPRYLSRAELKELASSRTLAGVKRALKANGWPHFCDAAGWPKILRSYYLARMTGAENGKEAYDSREAEPDWSVEGAYDRETKAKPKARPPAPNRTAAA
jgi:hypothetical protein